MLYFSSCSFYILHLFLLLIPLLFSFPVLLLSLPSSLSFTFSIISSSLSYLSYSTSSSVFLHLSCALSLSLSNCSIISISFCFHLLSHLVLLSFPPLFLSSFYSHFFPHSLLPPHTHSHIHTGQSVAPGRVHSIEISYSQRPYWSRGENGDLWLCLLHYEIFRDANKRCDTPVTGDPTSKSPSLRQSPPHQTGRAQSF